jgi:hypothetical protein
VRNRARPKKNEVKLKIINKNSADVRVTAVRARQAPKIIKINIIEKRRISEAP